MASRTLKAGYLAVAQGIASLVTILVAAVLSRQLSQNDYATYRQTLLTYRFVAPLIALGLPQSLLYFLPLGDERRRGIILEVLAVLSLVGSAFFLFLIAGGNSLVSGWFNNEDLVESLRWFAPYALLILPVSALNTSLIASGYPKGAALFSSISQISLGALVIGIVYFSDSVVFAIQGVIAHSVIVCGVALFVLWRISAGTSSKVSKEGLKSMLAYSIPLGVGGAVAYLNMNLDKVIVASWVNPAQYAVYVNGAMEVPFIGMLTGAASAIILPEMVMSLKKGAPDEALGLWKRASLKSAAILFPITAILWLMAPAIMVFLFGEAYSKSADIFRLYILLVPIRIGFFGIIYQSCGKSGLLLRRSALALILNLIATIPMTQWLGPKGAALSTILVSWVIMVPYNAIETARMLGVRIIEMFFWKDLARIACSSISAALVVLILDTQLDGYLQLPVIWELMILGGAGCAFACGFHILWGVWSVSDIRRFVSNLTKKQTRS